MTIDRAQRDNILALKAAVDAEKTVLITKAWCDYMHASWEACPQLIAALDAAEAERDAAKAGLLSFVTDQTADEETLALKRDIGGHALIRPEAEVVSDIMNAGLTGLGSDKVAAGLAANTVLKADRREVWREACLACADRLDEVGLCHFSGLDGMATALKHQRAALERLAEEGSIGSEGHSPG